MRAKSFQSCPTLCYLLDCSPPGSSVQGILQARILEWIACPPQGQGKRSRKSETRRYTVSLSFLQWEYLFHRPLCPRWGIPDLNGGTLSFSSPLRMGEFYPQSFGETSLPTTPHPPRDVYSGWKKVSIVPSAHGSKSFLEHPLLHRSR